MPVTMSFDLLYQEHYGRLYQRLCYKVHDPMLAEDLAQETLIKLWRAYASLDEYNLRGWLNRVADHAAIDALRRRQLVYRHETGPLSDEEMGLLVDPTTPSDDGEWSEALQHAFRQLPQSYQQVVLLFAQGYRHPEIAQRLGCTRQAVSTRLHRARRIFKQHYQEAS